MSGELTILSNVCREPGAAGGAGEHSCQPPRVNGISYIYRASSLSFH